MDIQQNMHFEMFSPSLQKWIECYMYPSENGLSLFFRDISERRQAEEAILRGSEELRLLASHLQEVREEERAAIAREIHDELGQQLTGIKMDISWISKRWNRQQDDPIAQKLGSTLGLLDNTIRTVRRIATELRPSILDDLGLIAAIEWQSQEFKRRSGINTNFRTSITDFQFEPSTAIGLFRICQESLTNVARHANAKNVWISLDWAEDRLTLMIRDDGKGMDKTTTAGKKTLGLLGMQERALMMGGSLVINSINGKGLTLEVTVPLKEPLS
jgi:signal transduction histidine kinase